MELEDPKQSKEKSKAKAKKSKTHGKDEDETSNAGNDVFDEETQEIERSEMNGQETSNEPGQTEEMEGVDESTQPELEPEHSKDDEAESEKKGLCIMP